MVDSDRYLHSPWCTRLDTFSDLVNLQSRWKAEYRIQFKGIEQRLRHPRRLGRTFDEPAFPSRLDSRTTDAEAEQGLRPSRLMEATLLSAAQNPSSSAFSDSSNMRPL